MLYVNRYCVIRNNVVVRNGERVFEKKNRLDDFAESVYNHLGISYPKFYKMDRMSKLGFLASEILLEGQDLSRRYASGQVALMLSNASASLDTDLRFQESLKTMASPALFVYTLPNIVSGEICIRHGLRGENGFFISSAFDAEQMCDYVSLVMATEKTQACIAGWVEVLGDQRDVFLYLVEKVRRHDGINHTAQQLHEIYTKSYGEIDG